MGTKRKIYLRQNITIRLDERLLKKIDMYCSINEITKTDFIEECIISKFKELGI